MFLPFFFTNPELMEGTQTRQDATTQPTPITALDRIARGMSFSLIQNDQKGGNKGNFFSHA